MMDEVDKILAQDPAEKEVAELAAATPVSAQPAAPAGAAPPPLAGYSVLAIKTSKGKKPCCFCGEKFKPNGLKRHIATATCLSQAFDPAMIPAGHYMVRTDSIGTPPTREAGAAAAPPAPEEDKDSSTGHEGDDAEDPGTAGALRRPRAPPSDSRAARGPRRRRRRGRRAQVQAPAPAQRGRRGHHPG